MSSGFDVIGDVHGHADKLEGLLEHMGYCERKTTWTHPERQAIFVGDLIDRGKHQRRTVELARRMVDAGAARIVLGNHEFNAIAWATPNPEIPGEHLRPHSHRVGARNRKQHAKFLTEVGEDSACHREYIAWFRSIPLWLDLGELRIVHACWNSAAMDVIKPLLSKDGSVTYALMVEGSRRGSAEYSAIETVLKGPEVDLPEGWVYLDKEPYTDDVPVIFGHYWRTGPRPADTAMTACVDYSAATVGPLVAYRWNHGDTDLVPDHFVSFPIS